MSTDFLLQEHCRSLPCQGQGSLGWVASHGIDLWKVFLRRFLIGWCLSADGFPAHRLRVAAFSIRGYRYGGGGGGVGSDGELSERRQVKDQVSLLGLMALPMGFPSSSRPVCRMTWTDHWN